MRLLSTSIPTSNLNARLAEQIKQIHIQEREWNKEQKEYETAVLRQAATATESVQELPLGKSGIVTSVAKNRAEERVSEHNGLLLNVDNEDDSIADGGSLYRGELLTSVTLEPTAASVSCLRVTCCQHTTLALSPVNSLLNSHLLATVRSSATDTSSQLARSGASSQGQPSPRISPCELDAALADSAVLELQESTVVKLAKQLRNFQGCTHGEHHKAEQNHRAHHARPDVHSACSSLQQITQLLRGEYEGATPIPDV